MINYIETRNERSLNRHPYFYHGRFATIGVGRIKAAVRRRAPHSYSNRRARCTHDPTHENYVPAARRVHRAASRRGARLPHLPVPESHEANAGEEATGSN